MYVCTHTRTHIHLSVLILQRTLTNKALSCFIAYSSSQTDTGTGGQGRALEAGTEAGAWRNYLLVYSLWLAKTFFLIQPGTICTTQVGQALPHQLLIIKIPHRLATDLYDGSVFSAKVPSSQMMLVDVKIKIFKNKRKPQQHSLFVTRHHHLPAQLHSCYTTTPGVPRVSSALLPFPLPLHIALI